MPHFVPLPASSGHPRPSPSSPHTFPLVKKALSSHRYGHSLNALTGEDGTTSFIMFGGDDGSHTIQVTLAGVLSQLFPADTWLPQESYAGNYFSDTWLLEEEGGSWYWSQATHAPPSASTPASR